MTVQRVMAVVLLALALCHAPAPLAANLVTMNLRDVDIAEAMAMLAKQQRLNILLSDGVQGSLSLNLYDVPVREAVNAIANAAGYAVEQRGSAYFVLPHQQVGLYNNGGLTEVQRFNVHYADPESLVEMLEPYLSRYGKIQAIPERKLILVSDKPEFLRRLALLVRHADAKPRQVIIQAQILEVSLTDEDSYGIDWQRLLDSDNRSASFGSRGLAGAGSSGSTGFFFDFVNPDLDVVLTALRQEGRVRTLSTPKLVALDNQEAEVIIGDRRGYQVTTTINQVTSESIEFLESGVILRVTPHIDEGGQVLMDIHPEVSNGTVDAAGIPSQTTTEVTTSLLVPSGETVFIGGLMKHSTTQSYKRVPVLGRVPGLKVLFSSREETQANTETIVLITPRVVESLSDPWNSDAVASVDAVAQALADEAARLEQQLEAESAETGFGLGKPRTIGAAGAPAAEASVEAAPAAVVTEPGRAPAAAPTGSPPVDAAIRAGADGSGDVFLDTETIRALPGELFTVQLMTMSSAPALAAYQREHALEELPSVELRRHGEPYFALLLGVYPSVAAAEAAEAGIPPILADKSPWVRRLRSLHRAMPPPDAEPDAAAVASRADAGAASGG